MNEDKIKTLKAWANKSCAYLRHGDRHSYSMGYFDGMMQAKSIVLDILAEDTDNENKTED